ncbi:type IV secretory system conjugative DNA transfer family protein [Actinokineospora enzanensis]|uniref:type IV secretory system conjugative DNA transfer family protein n=1 Tax=Actinokineospora enzanensis TaxID=155975 RepID=UPI0012EC33E2|nr:type IV secretory system conjugative DNA transfer family protein [Actinokineospora enzanensis]
MSTGELRDDVVLAWSALGLVVALEAVAGLLWCAEAGSAVVSGGEVPAFRWGIGPLAALVVDQPGGRRALTFALFAVLLCAVAVVVMRAASPLRRRLRARRQRAAVEAVNAVADVSGMDARSRERETARLHPGLAARVSGRPVGPDVLGVVLPSGPEVFVGWEDVEVAFMAPRSGKTTARAIPRMLAAPGPAVGTANKPDLFAATWLPRSRVGRVWRFDPQQVAHSVQEFWWNPLQKVRDDESARQLAAQFTQAIAPNGGDPFWANAAADVLSAFFLAAALEGESLREVWRWLNSSTDDYPVRLLDEADYGPVAEGLRNVINLHPETRDSVFQTARTGASCLRNPRILAWVTPQAGLPQFDMDAFVVSTDTVYLMSRDTAGAASPLLAGFLDQLFDAGQAEAERHGGRLPVPITAVLDEVGNIAPWDRLPKVVSFSGSIGVSITAILQSWAQGERVWGRNGMEMMFGAVTVKVFGAGIDDDALTRRISMHVGQHEVAHRTTTHGAGGRSDTVGNQQRDLLPPDAVRALPKGTALVMVTGRRPVMVRLVPHYESPLRDQVGESIARTRSELADRLAQQGQ